VWVREEASPAAGYGQPIGLAGRFQPRISPTVEKVTEKVAASTAPAASTRRVRGRTTAPPNHLTGRPKPEGGQPPPPGKHGASLAFIALSPTRTKDPSSAGSFRSGTGRYGL
jgi:hypothetical protein